MHPSLLKNYRAISVLSLAMVFLSVTVISLWLPIDISITVLLSLLTTLILPGLFVSFIFYPSIEPINNIAASSRKKKQGLDWIERIVFSVFVSITTTTLVFMTIQRCHVTITPIILDFVVIAVNIVTGTGALIARKKYKMH